MAEFPHDPSLDAQLRDIPLPEGFLARVKQAVAPSDEQLDGGLRDVRVPPPVLARLRMTPADEALDESLRDLAVPLTLAWRLRSIPGARPLIRFRRAAERASVAAALFIAISVTLFSSLGALLTTIYPLAAADDPGFAVIYDGPLTIENQFAFETPPLQLVLHQAEEVAVDESLAVSQMVSSARPPFYISAPILDSPAANGPVAEWTLLMSGGMRPMDDVLLLQYGVLGAPQFSDDELPELESPRMAAARGVEPPRVRGYNREFFLKYRVFPPISPVSPKLGTLAVPLTMADDSYRRTRALLRQNRWPSASEVRVEEFIAGQDYHFAPPAAGRLGIRTAAGPSPFGSAQAGLLQVGVQAGSLAKRAIPASHLIVALDVSTSMGRGEKLAAVRQGIQRLVAQMGPRDRVSLVIFAEEALQKVENAERTDAAAIVSLLDDLEPAGGTNLAIGLQQAASLALAESAAPGFAKRLVLITDSRAQMPAETFAPLAEMLAAAADANVQLCVLDVSERADPDPVMTRLAAAVAGDVRQATHERQISSTLLEWSAGQSPVVASEASLAIRFNPQSVAAYRLLGHEANAMAGLTAATAVVEMRAGDAASALLEVWFQDNDVDDVGEAELRWLDPASGKEQRLRQRISRLQFSPTFDEAAPALQAAAIAAETAELLRGSHESLRELKITPLNTRGFAGLLEVARAANPVLLERPDFQQLLRLIEDLERSRPR